MTVSYRHIIITLSFLLFYIAGNSQSLYKEYKPIEKVYSAGEKLNYIIRYGFFVGGKASLEVNKAKLNNQDILHMKVIGKSAGILSAVYNIKDVYESFVDPETDLPVKAIRNIKEGRYRRFNIAFFDRDSNTVYSTRKKKIVKVKPNALDILSAFYYARKHHFNDNMVKNDTIVLETFFAEEPFTLSIIYKGTETIRTKFGKVKCYRFFPIVERGRVFREDDDLSIWITADKNKIPIKIKFDIIIGSLVCELDSFGGLSNSFKVIVN